MDEEGPVDNVNQNNEERIRKKKKDKKTSTKSVVEAYTVDNVKAALTSENERVSELNKDHKGGKEKKKMKKNKGAETKACTKSGSRKSELNVVSGGNGGGLMIDKAERDGESSIGLALDNAERKRKRKEKDRNEIVETHDTGEVKRDASINWQEGENVSGKVSGKEVMKEKKKQKVKRNDSKVGEKDGEVIRGDSENCMVNATEIRNENKGKKKKKDDCFVVSRDTHNDNKSGKVGLSSKRQENVLYDVEDHTQSTNEDVDTMNNHKRKKKKKHKKKEDYKDDLPPAQQEYVDSSTNSLLNTIETQNNEAELTNKRMKNKSKLSENGSNVERDNEAEYAKKGKKRKSSLVVKGSDDTSPTKSNKKVRFSDQNEVFPLPPNSNTEEEEDGKDNLVRAKRFTPEEDEIVKGSVMKYIEEHELGDEGVKMILNSSKHPELKGCWKEIASSIPYRPYNAIYYRARILFMRSESRKWTQKEYDMILKYQEEHGNKWRALADELGKHTWHVKDTWRRIKLRDRKKGNWSQEEYQKLFDLVNTDLQLKLSEEKRSKHGMLRDNIAWTAISDELSTRAQASCCLKWYNQLTSPMVAQGVWADSDDYRLLSALYSLDATCMEDVGWDDLIDTRDGDVCRKRWNQMVLHLGHIGNKSFAEQVEVLAQRYCPHLLEARETWDSKPRVP
ncbi:RNA polymerase I termination factor-like [Salvia divinorum]|uniref:RNA polymerase I termination factor-like n=1 Tax=Salvia divinorum TaxID=28513 RepID=A0ABD1I5K8_SALDI